MSRGYLTVGIAVPVGDPQRAKEYTDPTIASIPKYLDRQRTQIEGHNNSLEAIALGLVRERRTRVSTANSLLESLKA